MDSVPKLCRMSDDCQNYPRMPVTITSRSAGRQVGELSLGDDNESTHTDRLLQAAGMGDRSALSELVDMHRDYLRRVIELRLDAALRGRVDASDVVQETQIVATRRIEEFVQRRPTSFKLWLRGEAMQQLGAQRRRHLGAARRAVDRECRMSDASSQLIARNLIRGTPSKIIERKELAERVRQIIETLPEADREMLILRYVEELSNSEAAELLGIERATARQRHGRALKRLLSSMARSGLTGESRVD